MTINDYATVAEVKQHLPSVTFSDTSYDALLTALITRASREADRITKRPEGAFYVTTSSTWTFDGPVRSLNNSRYMPNEVNAGPPMLMIGELAAAPTTVAVSADGKLTYTTWAATDYIMWPYNAPRYSEPYRGILIDTLNGTQSTWYGYRDGVQVTGYFGYSQTVPDIIKEAVIIQVGRWLKRGEMGFQDRVQVNRDTVKYVAAFAADKDMLNILNNFTRINL